MRLLLPLSILALAPGVLLGSHQAGLIEPPIQELQPFGILRTPSRDMARDQAERWLKSIGRFDEAAFQALWSRHDQPVLDLVADTLSLGSAEAKRLLTEVRAPTGPVPQAVPGLLQNARLPTYLRANLALAYAKALVHRRVYEEALATLRCVRPDQVIDPGAYYFHKAVAEYGLNRRDDARRSITHLIDDVPDAPQRYRSVAALMYLDTDHWQAKDLGDISRKMGNSGRRLDLGRAGPETRQLQRDIVADLNRWIERLASQQPPTSGGANPGRTPEDQPVPGVPVQPQQESRRGVEAGHGRVQDQKWRDQIEEWVKLQPTERAKAMTEMIRAMPPGYQRMIEEYYKRSAGPTQP